MLVLNFSPVVLVPGSSMHHRRKDLTVGYCIASEFIGYELPRHPALMFQCSDKESFSGSTVPAFSDQNVNDVPILIHCPPQVVALTPDRNEQFIDVPDVPVPSLFATKRSGIGGSKLHAPVSNGFV